MCHLRVILQRLRNTGLTIKVCKCQFGMATCTYHIHVVGEGSPRPEHAKVEAIQSMPVLQTKTQLRAFLGLTEYYRKFIPEYSIVALPLTDLTKRVSLTKLEWTSECDRAFQQLKRRLCSNPVLLSPNFKREFILQTDASNRGIGAVLSQLDDAGHERPVAYFSRKLLAKEEKYSREGVPGH